MKPFSEMTQSELREQRQIWRKVIGRVIHESHRRGAQAIYDEISAWIVRREMEWEDVHPQGVG